MEKLKDYWLQAQKDWSGTTAQKACYHVLLNVKKAIDLAPYKCTLYIKLPSGHIHTDTEPSPPYLDRADDIVLPTYFCDVDALADELKGLEAFNGLSVEVSSDRQYVGVRPID